MSGFGAHIKATPKALVVQKHSNLEEIPLSRVRHLLVMGGHTLHTSAVTRLLGAGSCISFFEADGEPVGLLKPYGFHYDEIVREAQRRAYPHSIALALAKGSAHARIFSLVDLQENLGRPLFYESELEILEKSYAELEYLIRLEEIRRVHRLISDMYYEILSRTVPPDLGFRRRTSRPHTDIVNTILSFGYGVLFGNTCVAAIGAHLDPDYGFLSRGKGGLVHDLSDPFKPAMVDIPLLSLVRGGISPEWYECTETRCILSEEMAHTLMERLSETLRQEIIDSHVLFLRDSLLKKTDFVVRLPEPVSLVGSDDGKLGK
ncbi:MAG: CRISPR-associated endonuclease Cas1 [Methanolinea sp.]|nr:CRISPR-associated endonuclease Cas1 [Methanolinea sp.]